MTAESMSMMLFSISVLDFFLTGIESRMYGWHLVEKVMKGAWRMPWLTEAMKDVISCDKLRVGANNL